MSDKTADPARSRLDADGFCVLEGLLDGAEAKRLDGLARRRMAGRTGYVKLEGALNHLPDLAPLCAHPAVMDLVGHLAGEEPYLANSVCLMWCQPGAPEGRIHSDWPLGRVPLPWPRFPLLVQTMWMLTDFTEANGGTRVVPGSHLSGGPPPAGGAEGEVAVSGRRGSVLVWHGALWHRNGANTTPDQHRMGANAAYIPWFVHRPAEAWPLVRRPLYDGFSAPVRKVLARSVEAAGPAAAPA